MKIRDIRKLVEGTGDPAFAIDPNGLIAAWNASAVELFGIEKREAIGRFCSDVIQGRDECGRNCSKDCTIQHQARNHQPVKSYEIQVNANGRQQWCNITVLMVEAADAAPRYTIHVVRPADLQKRFELLMRDFVVKETNLSEVNVAEMLSAKRTPTNHTELSKREIEILVLLSKGETTTDIAESLFISRTTVNNHIRNIFQKLGAHTRLEAIRRAEKAMLI
ncbi:MAG TPA: LuxR C-terminal-related transcriptional regulator [Pyrinomonadaceae bacterium]|nr:PAS domain-containing protein [Acidobacteriota bacterium]HQZ95640.1 LuxR C-terminal-related transcriptional regulator [Pyrinomonadaceae bacterium]